MATIGQIRGLILEEFILFLLQNCGYRILDEKDGIDIREGKSGLEVQGRGEWHQVDALVAYDNTPAFVFPVRLIVEAKAYDKKRPVGLPVVRNAVGVLKDLNENYFSFNAGEEPLKMRRFNYVHAIFSLNAFSVNAQRYALAHQVFLIQYVHNPLFGNVQNAFKALTSDDIDKEVTKKVDMRQLRMSVRNFIQSEEDFHFPGLSAVSGKLRRILSGFQQIQGSYFGLLNGEYPVHLTSRSPLIGLSGTKKIVGEAKINESRNVIELTLGDDNLLRMELPEIISNLALLQSEGFSRRESFVTITGPIENELRTITIWFTLSFGMFT